MIFMIMVMSINTYNATSDDNSVCMGRKTGTRKELMLKNFDISISFNFFVLILGRYHFDEFDIYVLFWSGLESAS